VRAALRFYHPTTGAVVDWCLTQIERLSLLQVWAAILVGLAAFWIVFARVALWVWP